VVGRDEADEIAILVSSPSRDRGEDFVQQHGLARFPYFVDEGGDWVQDEFGVMMSPTGLVMREGRLDAAMVFQDVAALRAAALSAPTGFEEKDDESSEGIDPDGSTQRFGTPPARRPGDERPLRSDDAVRPLHPG